MAVIGRSRRGIGSGLNVWPGWVDALSSLLMVVIFVLMVFMVAQFYLSNMLTGREELVTQLNRQVTELSDMLAAERGRSADLAAQVAATSASLRSVTSERDDLGQAVTGIRENRDALAQQLAALSGRYADQQQDQAAALAAANQAAAADRVALALRQNALNALRNDVVVLSRRRADLEGRIAALSQALDSARADADRSADDLAAAQSLAALLRDRLGTASSDRQQMADTLARVRATAGSLAVQLAAAQRMAAENGADAAALAERGRQLELQETTLAAQRAALAGQQEELRSQLQALADREAALAAQQAAFEVAQDELERNRTALAESRSHAAAIEGQLGQRDAELQQIRALLDASRTALAGAVARADDAGRRADTAEGRIAGLERDLRLAEADRDRLSAQLDALDDRSRSLQAALDQAQAETSAARQAAAAAADGRVAAEGEVASLSQQIAALTGRIGELSQALTGSTETLTGREARIHDLETQLKDALAERVVELEGYRSEFFGRLRRVLGDRPDVRVVGDRFVFQSEVLFPTGSAELQPGGQQQLAEFARTLIDISREFPAGVDWILRVDGHTDRRPINRPEFHNNWELSLARANAVVQFLIQQGVPPNRLAAAGFGEFQPLDDGDSDEAYARNRRIELKLDQRLDDETPPAETAEP